MTPENHRKRFTAWLVAAFVAIGIAYHGTFPSLVEIWRTNESFSHCFLVLPIALWLAWGKRHELAATPFRPSWLGVAALAGLALVWVVGRGSGVIAVEQFAAVASIPAATLAVLGVQAAWVLVFPLGFLLFLVPAGYPLVPVLMNVTADVATWALQVTGVPVFRSGLYITIPGGWFHIARACSGINYLITGLVLGVLYSYLMYSGWRKRLLSFLAFAIAPAVANGLRVYFTILSSHLTNMKFGPGAEHVTFGKVFFVLFIFAMFWVGRRWQDHGTASPVPTRAASAQPNIAAEAWGPALAACVLPLLAPPYVGLVEGRVEARLRIEGEQSLMPRGRSGWAGPEDSAGVWRPLYRGMRLERAARYQGPAGGYVDAFVGVYGIGTAGGSEMIAYGNEISERDRSALVAERDRRVGLPDGSELAVREKTVEDDGAGQVVWYWYMVGYRRLTSPYAVKAYEARAFLTGEAVTDRIVTLATPFDGHSTERLESFVVAHAACVSAGFAFEACGE